MFKMETFTADEVLTPGATTHPRLYKPLPKRGNHEGRIQETLDIKTGPRHIQAKAPEWTMADHVHMEPVPAFVVPKVLVLEDPMRNMVGRDADILPPDAASIAPVSHNLSS